MGIASAVERKIRAQVGLLARQVGVIALILTSLLPVKQE
jgi:hypothetical protein